MNISTFTVTPKIPEKLKPLEEISRNLWLSWNPDAINLFIRLDYDAWVTSQQNPAKMLGIVPQKRFEELASDDSYLMALETTYEKFKKYRDNGETWYDGNKGDTIAYFSMEYGMDISLPTYSGGLGILSGDHLKSSSDLGLPLVGVGLLYRQGYFQQYLNADGFQQESYPENDWYNMPVYQCRKDDGTPVKISVSMDGSLVLAQIWEVKVGRNSLFLLDTNIEENSPELRLITAQLYGGDKERRIRQEILLGMGGIRALYELGIDPKVVHMNEGHSAFSAIERIRRLIGEEGLSFREASQVIWATSIFTTHTPVPAGNERFSPDLMEKHFKHVIEEIGLSWHDFMALGREHPEDENEPFCMTVLAVKLSAYNNGVSELHGVVSREMWKDLWPDLFREEIPIHHITNGVHPRTWLSRDMLDLLDRFFGPRFYDDPTNIQIWDRMERISNEELWRTHERRRERLVVFARERMRQQYTKRGMGEKYLAMADDVLSPYALTISFARRFATYKRATLLFRDPDRLIRLLTNKEKPVQLIFSGKAHPHDIQGKELIKEIVHFASKPEIRSHIIFLENYDMNIAKHLVSGSDLWLNTPRRPLEASGTSGMKAAINGVLNCSVLDGWWAEAYEPEVGWSIGNGEEYDEEDEEIQDQVESDALYDLLERDIIPMFYNRGRDGLPREWISKMKASMMKMGLRYSCQRMLTEYSQNFYFPAIKNYHTFSDKGRKAAKDLAAYLKKVEEAWADVAVRDISGPETPVLQVGDQIKVTAGISLGKLSPEEVSVELYYGKMTSRDTFEDPARIEMTSEKNEKGTHHYKVECPCNQTGRHGFAVRVIPKHEYLVHPFLSGLIRWG